MKPWDRGFGEDDFVEGLDDELDELGIDYTIPRAALEDDPPVAPPQRRLPQQAQKAARVRPMSPTMAARNADVASILVTKYDGSQTLFVRR